MDGRIESGHDEGGRARRGESRRPPRGSGRNDGRQGTTLASRAALGHNGAMTGTSAKLTAAAEAYFADIGRIRGSGGATGELSYHPALRNLLNAVGAALKPKVFCVAELADRGAGRPDFGLFAARQVQKGRPREGQLPERGAVEVKAADDDAWRTAEGRQVSRYWGRYRLVLATNLRDFVLVADDAAGGPAKLETLRLAGSAEDFWRRVEKPRAFAREAGAGLGEYLARALSHSAALAEPKDLAWLLASYARDGLARVEAAGDAPALRAVRAALEEALGVRFEAEKGERFFHSTLVQTLFYGVFSAWVLWARQTPRPMGNFSWREAVWHLRAPVLRALFQQLSDPGRLQPLGLVEVLDWTAAALDRVDRSAFFARFDEGEAVPYFYEPFLQEFDPALRKQLGVWYTPREVVRYMVARVDKALKDDLAIPEGLAADNVYVLDPCCGTGAYLAEVLRRIAANLEGQGLGALAGARVKQAATTRVFGFEIMPAPFVVAHLQVGLTMQELDAPLADDDTERAGVFLTNALTGWEPTDREKQVVGFPEMEAERERANRVKRDRPILVILGNPPYNGHPGVAMDEERELTEAYRVAKRVRRPEGRGLNDLYIRFFRMAERRIVEKTGQGVVCFISNYSWLDGLSFTGMRERYLEAFDAVRVDCLNGDKYQTGKVAPDGTPDPSIFSTEGNPVGIQVGTAIATLVRKADHKPADSVQFRHLWGRAKRAELTETLESEPNAIYDELRPLTPLGLPFAQIAVADDWFDWPSLRDLFQTSFPGVQTSRDAFLVDVNLNRLKARIAEYFDPHVNHEDIANRYPAVMKTASRFEGRVVREQLLRRGGPMDFGFVRYAYRPFDIRWLYWEEHTELIHFPVAASRRHLFDENLWLVSQPKPRRDWSPPQIISSMCCLDLMDRGANAFPQWLYDHGSESHSKRARHGNLTATAKRYLDSLDLNVEDLFHHVLATLHDPAYREANAGALRMEWPRIPLPGWPDGRAEGAAEALNRSAARGRELAALLDPDTPVPGVTQAPLRPETAAIAVPTTTGGRNMAGGDFAVTAGWGHYGQGDAVMPGQGRAAERAFSADERAALGDALPALGERTFDIYLNADAFWRNVPASVWTYRLGGYQVLKKWLSYRERDILARPLHPEEVQHFTDTARRIAAILNMTGARTSG
ncbi:MAG: N-6 DNA methylase [Rhodospirillales bacterium]|nr:N-6 DNA methylase [Rhodospirillales bacterium]